MEDLMPQSTRQRIGPDRTPPEPEGHWAGVPYDWRKPTKARFLARWWNPGDQRLFTPRSFGWGYAVNLYWLIHPVRYFRNRS